LEWHLRPAELLGSYFWESHEFGNSDPEEMMDFRLIYQGPLLATTAGNTRRDNKHHIRKQLHKQLAELWKVQPPLKGFSNNKILGTVLPSGEKKWFSRLVNLADKHTVGPFRFAPLINKSFGLACRLEILFLRRESPGEIIKHGGDLDNRIKTLFDALAIPKVLVDEQPEKEEDPFFCLLEDDALVIEVNVTTDRLLIPIDRSTPEGRENDVYLIIRVRPVIVNADVAYIEFGL
jgi:hypothetical protein